MSAHILVIGPAPGTAGGISATSEVLEGAFRQVAPPDLTLEFVGTLHEGRANARAFAVAAFRAIRRTRRYMRVGEPVIWHLQVASRGSTYRKYFLSLIARLMRVPYVCHLHGARHHVFYEKSNRFVKRIVRSLFRNATATIVLGKGWRRYVVGTLGIEDAAVFVIPNGVNAPPHLSDNLGEGTDTTSRPSVIGFVGRIEQRKGVRELLDACDQLSQDTEFELLLFGDCRDFTLQAEVERRSYTTMTGWLPRAAVQAALADCDLFVLPSFNEGLPVALLEAMSMGLPSVSTAVGAIPEHLEDGVSGIVVEPGDAGALAEGIQRLLDDRALRRSMGKAAFAHWQRELRADIMFNRVERIWRAAAGEGA
jgi:glycosyltransferase involved in cell wall biosynthesis